MAARATGNVGATIVAMNSLRWIPLSCTLLLAGCGAKPAPAPAAPAVAAAEAATPEVLGKLAKADAKDGTVDKVVHRCAGCRLGMDGKAELALKVQDYVMHFCKKGCLDAFVADPKKEILALQIKE